MQHFWPKWRLNRKLESEQDGVVGVDGVGGETAQAGVDAVAVVDHLLQVVDVVDRAL